MNSLLPLRAVGLLGGTFDPVHRGHLAIARGVGAHFGLDQVRLIPAREPVHRAAPAAGAHHRLAMLRLATAPYPELVVDTREFDSPQQNYTLWTLQSLRAELPNTPLLWIIGEDAFAQLPGWHRWQELFDVAHFVVINRAGSPLPLAGERLGERGANGPTFSKGGAVGATFSALPKILQAAVAPRVTENKQALTSRPSGLVYHLSLPPQPASSTRIREALAAGALTTGQAGDVADLLPAPVLAYIARHALYQEMVHGR
ncbi:MAG: nicotinate (nicotinamide) nucleotide adenylyltransferase [Proteobacteria bacterium]|nr:nicotinate (nicotinamide) nucleotide adenylyltransferase [Pseudomonadota bacterium]MCL2309101.1 nicotinate (nicotinamide) nucleotide adenylyltransferase [Pseudomonadota bacterium]